MLRAVHGARTGWTERGSFAAPHGGASFVHDVDLAVQSVRAAVRAFTARHAERRLLVAPFRRASSTNDVGLVLRTMLPAVYGA